MKTTQILLYLSLVFLVFGSSSGYENVMSRMDWIGDAKDPKKWLLFVGKCLTQAATGLSRKFQSNYFAFLQFLLKKGKIFKMKAGQVLLKTELVRNPTSVILEDTRNKFIMRWTVDVSPWFRVNLTVKTLNAREMFGSCLDGRLALLQLSVKPIQHDFCGIHSGFTFYTQSSFVLLKLISKRQKVKLHMLISVFSKGLISNQFVKKATANECESLFLHYILTPKTFVHTFRVQLKRIFLLSIHLIKNSNGTFIVFDGPGILSDKHSLVKNFHSSSFQCLMQLFFAPAHKTDRLFLGLKFSKRFSHIRKILDDTESIQSFSSKNWTCDSPESSILELHAKTQYRVNITLKKFIFDGKPSTNCQYGGVTVYFDKNMTSSEHFCDKVEAGKTTGWTYTWSLLSDHNTLICIHYAYERYSKIETVLQVSATDCHVKRIKVCREGYLRYPKSLIGYERLETDRIARPNGCVVFQVDSGILYPHKQNIKLREKHGRYSIKKVTSVCFLYFHLSSKYPKVETWSLVLSGFFDGNQPGRTLLYIPPGDPRLLHKGRYLLTKYWDSRSSHTTAIKKSTSSIRSQVVDLSFFLEFFFITSTGMESVLLNLMLRFYLWADSWLNILLRPSNHSFVTPKTKPWLLNAHKTDRLFLGLKFSKRFSHIRKILDDTESIQSFSSKNWTCDSPESSILELHAKTQYRVNITLKKFIFDGKPSTNCQYGGVTVYFDKNMTSSEHFCDKVEAGKTTGWTYTWSLLSDHNTLICIHYAYERYSKIETVLQVSATDCHVKRIKVCREGYLRYPKSLIGYERLETDRIARPNGCVVFQVDSGILYPHKQNIKLREKHGRYSIKKVTSVCFLYFHLSSKYPKVETWSLVLSGFFDGNQPGRTLLYIPPGDPRLLHKGRYLLTKYWDSRSSHTTAIKKSTSSIRSQVVDLSFFLEFFFITSTGMESVLLNLMLRFYLWADSWLNILLRPSNHSFVTPKTKPWLLNAMTGNMSTVRRPSHVNAIDGLVIELPSAQSSSGDNAVSCNIEGVSHNSDFDSTYLKMKHYKLHKLVTRLVLVFKLDFSKYEICCHHQPLTPTTTPLTIHWTNESFPLQREVDIFKKYLRKENVKKEYNEVNIFCNINITLVDPFPLWYIYTHKPLLSSFNWRAAFANKTLFSWNDAQQYCHQHGMQLLTVFSFQKLTCVLFWLKVSSDLLSVDAIFLDLRFNERQVRLCP